MVGAQKQLNRYNINIKDIKGTTETTSTITANRKKRKRAPFRVN